MGLGRVGPCLFWDFGIQDLRIWASGLRLFRFRGLGFRGFGLKDFGWRDLGFRDFGFMD